MTETNNPNTSADSQRRPRQVHATFTVDTPSGEHAATTVRYLIRALMEGRERHADLDEPRSRVTGWSLTESTQLQAWQPFEDTGIPEIVAEMFPPEPHRGNFRTPAGGFDEEAFEDAHEQWRDECLTLAISAARLPDLVTRLEGAERVSDAVVDVMARYPLPEPPRVEDYSEGFFRAGFNEAAYSQEHARWQQDLQDAVAARETALETVLDEDGKRTAYLPPQFQAEWVSRDLMAISTLRALLEADPAVTGRLLDRGTRAHLEAMLFAADPDVRIADPDDPDGPELYEGLASEAHRWVPPGVFEATGVDGRGEFRVVVGRTTIGTEPTVSAAFPPAEHDSIVLSEISHALETAPQQTPPQELLEQVNQLVTGTGRAGQDGADTMLERGALLDNLLAQRNRELDGQERPQRPAPGPDDPDLTR